MSTPEAGERLVHETVSTPARRAALKTRMLAWSGVDGLRLEAARVVLGARSMRAGGSMISAPHEDTETYSAAYSLTTDEAGVIQRLTVRTIRAQGEQSLSLTRSEEGIWLIDRVGQGAALTVRTSFGGALDVDLAFSPLFNALPVRRLGLHHAASQHDPSIQHNPSIQHDLPVVSVSLPDLEVGCVRQTYRTVTVGETTVVGFATGVFIVELTVDTDGLVLDYPGLALRT